MSFHCDDPEAGYAEIAAEQGDTLPTSRQIDTAARALAQATWGALGGGFMVYDRRDLTGGAWYSAGSRPQLGPHSLVVQVPSWSVSIEGARAEIVIALGGCGTWEIE